MDASSATVLVFAALGIFHFWGGGAIGAGLRARRALPVGWGLLVGVSPLYFGIERFVTTQAWAPLASQVAILMIGALAVAFVLPGFRILFLRRGMATLMTGSFIMAAGALLGAWLYRIGAEVWSQVIGGAGFLFGAMWFGAGIKQLRGK